MKTAIIIIDLQNYFVNKHTKHLPSAIAAHLSTHSYNYVLFTKVINHTSSNWVKLLNWRRCLTSPDIDIHPSLAKFLTPDNVFEKTSYSVFKSRQFTNFLRVHRIGELYFCGIDLEACVLASAYEAFDSGYKVHILEQLCGSHAGSKFFAAARLIIGKNIQK